MTVPLIDSKYGDIVKRVEKEGMHIEYDGAMEILVFSSSLSPGKNQVAIGIIIQPSLVPQTRTSDAQITALERPVDDQQRHIPPVDHDSTISTPPDPRKPEPKDRPPQKRRKVGQYPGGTQGAETDGRLDLSMLGQQPQVKIVRDLSNPTFQTGEIIGLDEHDTLYVQKGYTVMMLIRYRIVETPKALEEGPITSRKIA